MDNNEILQQHIEGYKKSIIDIISGLFMFLLLKEGTNYIYLRLGNRK